MVKWLKSLPARWNPRVGTGSPPSRDTWDHLTAGLRSVPGSEIRKRQLKLPLLRLRLPNPLRSQRSLSVVESEGLSVLHRLTSKVSAIFQQRWHVVVRRCARSRYQVT